jgi:hypothetical protein
MSRVRLIHQRDLVATLKATKAAGLPVARIEVLKDRVVVITGTPGEPLVDPDADPEILAALEDVRNAEKI